jgi:hypothetical protein
MHADIPILNGIHDARYFYGIPDTAGLGMSTLLQLLARKAELEADAAPLREQLERLDEAIDQLKPAEDERNRLLAAHDDAVANSLMYGCAGPPVDPALNLSEIRYREAQHRARAALGARDRVVEQLQAVEAEINAVAGQIAAEVSAIVPGACYLLFEAAERSQRQPGIGLCTHR